MKPLLIVKAGETFPQLSERLGDFEDWIEAGLGQLACPVVVFDPRRQAPLPFSADIAGAVVTGSHGMVTDREAWSEKLAVWLATLVENDVPVLGICYGHQLLAHALGGEVVYRSEGREVGTVRIMLHDEGHDDPLLGSLNPHGAFLAHAIHSQSVRTLPQGAVLLAYSELEPHAAFRAGACAWGVQFHPEFSDSIMANYIQCLEPELSGEGHDALALLKRLVRTETSALVLRRFGLFAEARCRLSSRTLACE